MSVIFTWVNLPIVPGPGGPTLQGGAGNDSLQGTPAAEVLDGGAGTDTLVGGGGSDWFVIDRIEDLVVDGESGDSDVVLVAAALTGRYTLPAFIESLWSAPELPTLDVLGNALGNTVLGGNGDDRLAGAAGDDSLRGGLGRNTLTGGDGNDTLAGDSGGLDSLDGGSGDDWLSADGSGTLLGGEGSDTLQAYRDDDIADLLDGGPGNDQLSARSAASRLLGGDGHDQLTHSGDAVTLEGGAGDDSLWGGGAGAVLIGGAGRDELRLAGQISTPGSVRTLLGGAGDDLYSVDSPLAVQVVEVAGEGHDTVNVGFVAGLRVDVIPNVEVLRIGTGFPFDTNPAPMVGVGDEQANHLIAARPGVVIEGAGGNDRLVAEAGFATLRGGAGNDTLDGQMASGPSRYDGGDGDDLVHAGFASGVLLGGAGNDTLDASGSFGASLHGGAGDDVLRGGTAVTLVGGPGADTLIGSSAVFRVDDVSDVIEATFAANTAEVALSGWWVDRSLFGAVRYVDEALPAGYWLQALIGSPLLPVGRGGELTFTLPQDTDIEGFTPFGAAERSAVAQAFALWSAGTRLSVREVVLDGPTEPGEVDIAFGFADLSETGVAGVTVPLPELGLTVVLIDAAATGQLATHAVWNTVLLHEVGHALGLKHPGNYNAAGEPPQPPFLPGAEDSTRFTLMSYIEPVPRGEADFVTTLPPLDRAVMRLLYGMAPGNAGGDTRWVFDGAPTAPRWIEDSDGTDTLDASGFVLGAARGVTLDLRIGGRSFAGTGAAPTLVTSAGQWVVGHDSVLEHAIGGPGADKLQGNEGANSLLGGDGDDTLSGAPGNDTLDGGAGNDRLLEWSGANRASGGDGDDVFVFTVRDDVELVTTLSGGNGSDRLELRIASSALDAATIDRLVVLREQLGAGDSAAPWRLQLEGIESVQFRDFLGAPLPNQAPRAFTAAAATREDEAVTGRLPAAFDFEGDLLGYGLLSGSPGFEVQPDGRYSYTPPPGWSGSAEMTYRVSDGLASSTARFTVEVASVDDAPVLLRTPSDVDAVVGVPFATHLQFFAFRDDDTPFLSYSLRRADGLPLPAWLRFDAESFALQGTPGVADAGVLSLQLVAADSATTVAAPFLLGVFVQPNHDPESPGTLQATEDQVFVGRLPATDADGDPLRYEMLSTIGTVASVELGSDGSLRITPQANYWGDDNFLVRVSDGRGGSAEYFARVYFAPVDDTPINQLVMSGEAKVGTRLHISGGVYDPDNVYATGPGRWLRGETVVQEVRGHSFDIQYLVTPDDVGAVLRYEVNAIDPLGNPVSGSVATRGAVLPMGLVQGTAGADRLTGWDRASSASGGGGNDTLVSMLSFDRLSGGAGDDVLASHVPGGALDGGEGFDTFVMTQAVWRRIDLKAGVATEAWLPFAQQEPTELVLTGLEAVAGSYGNEFFIGLDGPAQRWGETFRPVGGIDTMDGGAGIDTVELDFARADAQFTHDGAVMTVANRLRYPDAVQLTSVERLRFADVLLAFGSRATEVAQVAFALWSKDIAGSQYLFARGISYYDAGYSFETMVAAALSFFAGDNEQQFAERLAGNVASGRSAADVLALMQANGGAGAGQPGRAYATQLVAGHADNLRNIELAGFITGGIPCALVTDGNLLFAPIGTLGG